MSNRENADFYLNSCIHFSFDKVFDTLQIIYSRAILNLFDFKFLASIRNESENKTLCNVLPMSSFCHNYHTIKLMTQQAFV